MSAARVIIDGYHLSADERMFLYACVMSFVAQHTDIEGLGLDVEVVLASTELFALKTKVTPMNAVKLITPLARELAQTPPDQVGASK